MTQSSRRPLVAAAIAVTVSVLASPAAADWLVLEDGGRVETRGPWEVRGKLVVFTLPNGTLSSVRTAEVDLDGSRAATEAASRPPEPPPPPPPKPKARVVLDEADLPPVNRPPAGEAGVADTDSDSATESDPRLRVEDWSTATPDGFEGTVVSGRLRNVSSQLLMDVGVDVALYSVEGELLEQRAATVPSGPVAPDRVLDFQVDFPGTFGAAGARFQTRALAFLEDGATGTAAPADPDRGRSPTHNPMDGAEAAAAETPPAP